MVYVCVWGGGVGRCVQSNYALHTLKDILKCMVSVFTFGYSQIHIHTLPMTHL